MGQQHLSHHDALVALPDSMRVHSANPIRIDPLRIADIQVLETIKAGQSVYRRNEPTASRSVGEQLSCAASPKCFTAMAPVGASLTGQELHHH